MHPNERKKMKKRALEKAEAFVKARRALRLYDQGDYEAFKKVISEILVMSDSDLLIGTKVFRYVVSAEDGNNTVYGVFRYGRKTEVEKIDDPEDIEIILKLKKAIFRR
jgi:choline kinase